VGEVAGRSGMKAVLNDEELDRAECLFEQFVVGEGDGRVRCDEP